MNAELDAVRARDAAEQTLTSIRHQDELRRRLVEDRMREIAVTLGVGVLGAVAFWLSVVGFGTIA